MKTNRSLAEALSTAKQLRRKSVGTPTEVASNRARVETSQELPTKLPEPSAHPKSASAWVRHTVGLRAETSLKLRDAADIQKRKARHGRLQTDEPANEQEIADLGVRLALNHLRLS